MPGAQRTRSLACNKKHARCDYRYAETSGIPCAMVYGLCRALPGVRALIATVVGGSSANLTSASGGRDHTVSPSASMRFVRKTEVRYF
jgi:hypothetical protein